MLKPEEYENKLYKLAKANPDFAPVLKEAFPELKERDEKFHTGTKPLFMMRKDFRGNLYCLKYKDSSGHYYVIMNLTTMQEWTSTQPVDDPYTSGTPFITVLQFKELCKGAGVKYEDMLPIPVSMLNGIYNTLILEIS